MARKRRVSSGLENGKTEVDVKPVNGSVVDPENDSEDEADLRNTIGNVPIEWYDDYDHIGYSLTGEKIAKGEGGTKKGEIDEFIDRMEDPNYWRKVFDHQTGGEVVLTDAQVEKLNNMVTKQYPDPTYNPYQPFYDIFSHKKEIHPISNKPEDKRSFIPSEGERKIVGRILHAMKMGWIKPKEKAKPVEAYDLWASEDAEPKTKTELSRMRMHCPAPKTGLPTHAESYNPPSEYLLDENEKKKWEDTEPQDRRINFMPQKYDSLRKVPFYENFYRERYDRCQDLCLAPRQVKMRLDLKEIKARDLLPDLPNPKDLQPFPTTLGFYMRGHKGQIRSISVEPTCGELLASGGEDGTVRIWYIPTGRCLKVHKMGAPVSSVAYSPNPEQTLILVGLETEAKCVLLNADCGDKLRVSQTREFLKNLDLRASAGAGDGKEPKWTRTKSGNVEISLPNAVRQVTWHRKGDFFATVGMKPGAHQVYIHKISGCKSQKPFTKRKGEIITVLFHPTRPHFFAATQQHVRIYELNKCAMLKKVYTGSRWLSGIQCDPRGNNLFVVGLDRTFSWIDLQVGDKPWKTMRSHASAVRAVAYHQKYPLLATVGDDATAIVYYAKCPDEFDGENMLVPVKRLFGHKNQQEEKKKDKEELAMLTAVFHPTQPWLLTGGADGQIGVFIY